MAIVRWEPFAGVGSLKREMDRLFDDFLGLRRGSAEDSGLAWAFAPAVDIYEKGDEIVVKANIPGVNKDDIKVSVVGNTLTIRGEKKQEEEVKEENYYCLERASGAFSRTITLPNDVEGEKTKANYKDGVLELRIPKHERAKAKEIKISTN